MSYHLQGTYSGYFRASIAVSFQCGFIEATRTLDLQNCLALRQVLFLACIDTEQSGKQPACEYTALFAHIERNFPTISFYAV